MHHEPTESGIQAHLAAGFEQYTLPNGRVRFRSPYRDELDAARYVTQTPGRAEFQEALNRMHARMCDRLAENLYYPNPAISRIAPEGNSTMHRPNLGTILDMPCDQIKRRLRTRDGYTKTEMLPGNDQATGMYLMLAQQVHTPRGVALSSDTESPPDTTIRSLRFRLVSAGIRVGTPNGVVKDLWYEEA